ncbi:MAG: caspase family protein, partial [Candidatus Marinimicrobia bacterium]|nr:caspase family protein [Candidatus Neomarinimicrobiota bacterium]
MYKFLPILLFAYSLAVTTEDIYDNSYALIIGIDKYDNTPLDYAVKDAESVANLLKENFNFSSKNITTLLNEEATLSNIKNSLSKIASSAIENDRVLIYFAGHGVTDILPDGGEMGYLLPIDGKVDNLFATSIPMDDIKRISSISKSKHMLFLVDACYGGLSAVGARGLDATTTPNYIDKITKDKSRQIITAGGRGEKVIEKSEWGHSAFTLNL